MLNKELYETSRLTWKKMCEITLDASTDSADVTFDKDREDFKVTRLRICAQDFREKIDKFIRFAKVSFAMLLL